MTLNIGRIWLPYNCGKVIDTPVQGSDLNRIKKKRYVSVKRNMTAQQTAILEKWQDIPDHYDLQNLIHSIKTQWQYVATAKGGHTKY